MFVCLFVCYLSLCLSVSFLKSSAFSDRVRTYPSLLLGSCQFFSPQRHRSSTLESIWLPIFASNLVGNVCIQWREHFLAQLQIRAVKFITFVALSSITPKKIRTKCWKKGLKLFIVLCTFTSTKTTQILLCSNFFWVSFSTIPHQGYKMIWITEIYACKGAVLGESNQFANSSPFCVMKHLKLS